MATILPKQKLSVFYFRNSEFNGLYEHCFVLCRGLLICLQIFHYKGGGILFSSPALLNGKQFSLRRDIVYYESSDFLETADSDTLKQIARTRESMQDDYFDTDGERWQHEV